MIKMAGEGPTKWRVRDQQVRVWYFWEG